MQKPTCKPANTGRKAVIRASDSEEGQVSQEDESQQLGINCASGCIWGMGGVGGKSLKSLTLSHWEQGQDLVLG